MAVTAQPLLSACLIVRDEADLLPRCLASIRDHVDEICVVDTGSRDDSVRIARSFGARVDRRPWDDDFGAARNAALELAAGRWILVIDADEELHHEDGRRLRQLLQSADQEAYFVQVLSYVGEERVDRLVRHQVVRLVRNRPCYRYRGRIHEGLDLHAARGAVGYSDIRIVHYGYLDRVKARKGKAARNLHLLEQAVARDPENPFLRFNLGTEYLNLGDFAAALVHFDAAAARASPSDIYASLLAKRRIVCLQALGRHFRAVREARRAERDFPHYTDLTYLRGISLLHMGQLAAALSAFRSCLERGEPAAVPQPAEEVGVGSYKALWWIGQIHERLGDAEAAAEAYRQALAAEPRFVPALERLIAVLREQCNEEEAVAALDLPPGSGDAAVLAAADIFRRRGDYVALRTLLEAHPLRESGADSRRYWYGLARVRTGQADGVALLARVGRHDAYAEPAARERIVAAWLGGDLPKAGRLLHGYERRFGPTAAARVYGAVQACLAGQHVPEAAPAPWEEAADLFLDVLRALARRLDAGTLARLEGLAIAWWGERAVGPLAALYRRAGGHDRLGLREACDRLLGRVSDAAPLGWDGWVELARLALQVGRLAEAVTCYQRAGCADTCRAASYVEPARALVRQAARVVAEGLCRFPQADPLLRLAAVLGREGSAP